MPSPAFPRTLAGLAAAAAVTVAVPLTACAQSSLPGGSSGSIDTSLIPPGSLFPATPGIGAGEGVAVVEGPAVETETVMDGLTIPWDVVRAPEGTLLTGERGGRMVVQRPGEEQREIGIDLPGLFRQSESGLMGMAVDAGFAQNREIHVCWSRSLGGERDNRISTFAVDEDWTAMTKVRDTLTGIPLGATGLHSGCRLLTAPDGSIYIGTGDTFTGPAPQDPESLAGKNLHITPDGDPATGDSVVHTIGHRNIQGLAIHPDTGRIYSAEHGPDVDDEVNLLEPGGNYGWNPDVGGRYDQNVPMTDTARFPDAIEAVWSSGAPTLAPADIEFLGPEWGEWAGALAMANLKTQKLVLLRLSDDGRSVIDASVLLEGEFGRLRSLAPEPDGSLLVTTSDGDGRDSVFRVSPAGA
ncbi:MULTISPECIES: PQQ-dependent sugar dehydrogenase [Dietzia]|uniref:Glucose/arabinose dehydrogenase n=2 Tax=Dietzia cinnamea TaxID=321318 RepID=A0A4R3ZT44_9ACTN|nr:MULTISPECIES: PQQ-dependent sugar dehydrogenase [Dietzia]KZO59471.1 glucose dehydrogenase [Dietzia maris]MBM7230274.1 PQQ-dependent sugar dehydrogenase [Dietzia cinnamea]MCT1886243.1 PQQ-dependent sugar dehydrogenase [Dietzia cinnamea]MCT2057220.1 PQQ-dependent sugar dehydrogenase [Dietzia cinnamea]MCT2097782.1 PQQ-dependent sugar dehydrogenase [Dietzia cinnamea]